jgi:long-chain fatty acid transport protein
VKRFLVLASLLAAPSLAHAGGLSRPFNGSAASSGMAGAFGAIADDPSCLSANPAGCAYVDPGILVSLDVVYAPRSYVPIDAAGTEGPAEDAAAVAPAPTIGAVLRPGAESRLRFGIGAWNSYGGTLSWEKTGAPAVNASTELVFEVGVGAAWQIDDRVAIGALVRMGIGLFAVDATAMPADADISANGVGVGAGLGLLIKASDKLSFGLAWKSPMNISTAGSGTANGMSTDVGHVQHWPQSMTVATAFRPSPQLTLGAQLDYVQWSSFESLDIDLDLGDQHFSLDWSDSMTARLGLEYRTGPKLALRGGVLYDSNSVPDDTIDRQYLDGPKFGVAAGAGFRLSKKVILDACASAVAGPTRSVEDNTAASMNWGLPLNEAPGEHSGQVFTLTTGVRVAL